MNSLVSVIGEGFEVPRTVIQKKNTYPANPLLLEALLSVSGFVELQFHFVHEFSCCAFSN